MNKQDMARAMTDEYIENLTPDAQKIVDFLLHAKDERYADTLGSLNALATWTLNEDFGHPVRRVLCDVLDVIDPLG